MAGLKILKTTKSTGNLTSQNAFVLVLKKTFCLIFDDRITRNIGREGFHLHYKHVDINKNKDHGMNKYASAAKLDSP